MTVNGSGTYNDPYTYVAVDADWACYDENLKNKYVLSGSTVRVDFFGNGEWEIYINSVTPGMGLTAQNGSVSGTVTQAGTVQINWHYVDVDSWEFDDTTTFYVVSRYTHTIAYNANGGSGTVSATTVTDYNSGDTNVTFASNGFTAPSGYHFGGWRINNTGTVYQPNDTYSVSGNSSVTAYAYWLLTQATIPVKVSGSWTNAKVSVKVSGNWVPVKKVYINDNGVWKETR